VTGKKGLTLVEVIFSLAIVGLVLGSAIAVFVQTTRSSKTIDCTYSAVGLARMRIESARHLIDRSGFEELTQAKFGEDKVRINSDGFPDREGDFYRTTTVVTDYDDNAYLTSVEVSISYVFEGRLVENASSLKMVFVNI